jgi:hypothetical protein
MKDSLRRGLKFYKYLSLIFSVSYWIYIVIDDYIFIEKYWESHWLEYLGIWSTYFLIYFVAFSCYFWIVTMLVVLIDIKVIKPMKEKKNAL